MTKTNAHSSDACISFRFFVAKTTPKQAAPMPGKKHRRRLEKEKGKDEHGVPPPDMSSLVKKDHQWVCWRLREAKKHFGLESIDATHSLEAAKAFTIFMEDIATRFLEQLVMKPNGLLRDFCEYKRLIRERGKRSSYFVLKMENYHAETATSMAAFVWAATKNVLDAPGQPMRERSEILRIVNEPDTTFLYKWMSAALIYHFGGSTRRDLKPPLKVYNWLASIAEMLAAESASELAELSETLPRPPRKAPSPTPLKSLTEYERNVQAAKNREAQEAAERLAEQKARDAMIARKRDAATQEQTRLEQEREDALVRQLERTSLAHNSHAHTQQAPLSPASEAKRLVDAQKARKAKEQDIAETRTRIKEQKAVQAVKDAEEAREQDRRAEARDTAKRIAHGEGYSKRKGNRE